MSGRAEEEGREAEAAEGAPAEPRAAAPPPDARAPGEAPAHPSATPPPAGGAAMAGEVLPGAQPPASGPAHPSAGPPMAGEVSADAQAVASGLPHPAAEGPDLALLAEAVRIAEALTFASDRPVTPAMLAAVLPGDVPPAEAMAALAAAAEGRGVVLTEVAGGWAFRTAPDLAPRLTKVVQAPRRLPRAAMEALSVIAYHQPCTRGEIEEIRGATLSQTTLEALLELGLIAPRGRREVPGRPSLWGTTPRFLEQFGLKSLADLPRREELVTAETGPALPGLAPEPAGEMPEPVEEASELAEEAPEPAGEVLEPVEETPAPAGEVPEPAGEISEPAGGTPEPVEETPEPAEEAPEPPSGAAG